MTRADIARPVTLRPAPVTPPAKAPAIAAIIAGINGRAYTPAELARIAFVAQAELQDREATA